MGRRWWVWLGWIGGMSAAEAAEPASGPQVQGIVLTVDPLIPGATVTFTVSGAGANEAVYVARGDQGLGLGPCFGTAGTFCLDILGPIAVQGTAQADAAGIATVVWTVPESVPFGRDLWFQAVIPRGVSGLSWVKSNALETITEDAPLTLLGLFPGDLRITELMVQPSVVGVPDGQWIEIQNVSGADTNLDGLVISDGINQATLVGTTYLADGDRMVLGPEANPFANGGVAVDRPTLGLSLAPTWGEVSLIAGNVTVDTVVWDDGTAFPLQAGSSMSLEEGVDHLGNDVGSNWCTSLSIYGFGDAGTPGDTNDSC